MKLYKTVITYELECITDKKLDKDTIERLKHNIDINIGSYNMVRTDGKIETVSKEIQV
jgi:hypothetical protein